MVRTERIKVSGLETLNSSCKVWQPQRWVKTDWKNCLISTKQTIAGIKTLGLVGLWATFEAGFFMFWGAKKNSKILLKIF